MIYFTIIVTSLSSLRLIFFTFSTDAIICAANVDEERAEEVVMAVTVDGILLLCCSSPHFADWMIMSCLLAANDRFCCCWQPYGSLPLLCATVCRPGSATPPSPLPSHFRGWDCCHCSDYGCYAYASSSRLRPTSLRVLLSSLF